MEYRCLIACDLADGNQSDTNCIDILAAGVSKGVLVAVEHFVSGGYDA
jgi:tyrosine-protein phosphatase YwqE